MIIDASGMIAIIDALDPSHRECINALEDRAVQLHTTAAALTEAMHVSASRFGWKGCQGIWRMCHQELFEIHGFEIDGMARTHRLMEKYRDLPMDFADATLVVLAEDLKDEEILTLDSDFRVYRMNGRKRFRVMP